METVIIFFALQLGLNTKIVTAHLCTDPVTEVFKDKLVDSKQLHDPVGFVAVKSEVTVSLLLILLPPPPTTYKPKKLA
jgi:hypothetical protein